MSRAANIVNQPAPADPTPADLGVYALPEQDGTPAEEPERVEEPKQELVNQGEPVQDKPPSLVDRVHDLETLEEQLHAHIAALNRYVDQVSDELNALNRWVGRPGDWRPNLARPGARAAQS